MSEHTSEPWHVDTEIWTIEDGAHNPAAIASLAVRPERAANGRRIVAAINACCGVPTEALEALQPGWWQRNAELRMQNAELLAAAEGLLDAIDRDDVTVAEFEGRIRAARAAVARAKGE
jgi:folylpolyglutamate synthase/dihydropteroate synthase